MTSVAPETSSTHGMGTPAAAVRALRRDLPVLGLAAAFVVLFVTSTWGMPAETRIFPYFAMTVLVSLGAALVAIETRAAAIRRSGAAGVDRHAQPDRLSGAGLLLVLSVGFMAVFWLAGFVVASALFLTVTLWRLGQRPWTAVLVAAGVTAGLYGLFRSILGVPL